MNLTFIAADTLQKVIVLVALIFCASFTKIGYLDWLITTFPLSTLPNNLVIGVPLLVAMYGEYCHSLTVQIVVMQCVVWYTLLLFLFEYRAAKMLITEKLPDTAGSIASVKVDSDVVSLAEAECFERDVNLGGDINGKVHVILRKPNTSTLRHRRVSRSDGMTRAQSFPKRKSSFDSENVTYVWEAPTSDSEWRKASAKSRFSAARRLDYPFRRPKVTFYRVLCFFLSFCKV